MRSLLNNIPCKDFIKLDFSIVPDIDISRITILKINKSKKASNRRRTQNYFFLDDQGGPAAVLAPIASPVHLARVVRIARRAHKNIIKPKNW
jgi:hypothetical protein